MIGNGALTSHDLKEEIHHWIFQMTDAMMQRAMVDYLERFPTAAEFVTRILGGYIQRVVEDTKMTERYAIELVERYGRTRHSDLIC